MCGGRVPGEEVIGRANQGGGDQGGGTQVRGTHNETLTEGGCKEEVYKEDKEEAEERVLTLVA